MYYTIVGDWYSGEAVPDAFSETIEAASLDAALRSVAEGLAAKYEHCEECAGHPENIFTGAKCAYVIRVFESTAPLNQVDSACLDGVINEMDKEVE